MLLDWGRLRIFHIVAESGSFTRAGEKLNISQSAVSRQISTLEETMKVSLFHRHARGLVLTEQGELLFETTQDIYKKIYSIEGQISDSRQLADGPLLVTVAEFFGSTWLTPRLHFLRQAHQNLQLTLLFDDRILNLGMREADVAIRLTKPEQQDLIQRHLATIDFCICASKTYLDAHGTPSHADTLKNHWLIGFPDMATSPIPHPNWLLENAEIDLHHPNVLAMNSILAKYEAIKAGAGIGTLPLYMLNDRVHDGIEIILPEVSPPSVDMYFVYASERKNSVRINTFRDFLLEHIRKTQFSKI